MNLTNQLQRRPMRRSYARKEYDLFLSYASEDRDTVVLPLLKACKELALTTWYDESELLSGDIISALQKGIVLSQHAVMIISPAYLTKDWTTTELEMLQFYAAGRMIHLIPIAHSLTTSEEAQIKNVSLFIGRLRWLSTSVGTKQLASNIDKAVTSNRHSAGLLVPSTVTDHSLTTYDRIHICAKCHALHSSKASFCSQCGSALDVTGRNASYPASEQFKAPELASLTAGINQLGEAVDDSSTIANGDIPDTKLVDGMDEKTIASISEYRQSRKAFATASKQRFEEIRTLLEGGVSVEALYPLILLSLRENEDERSSLLMKEISAAELLDHHNKLRPQARIDPVSVGLTKKSTATLMDELTISINKFIKLLPMGISKSPKPFMDFKANEARDQQQKA